MKVDKGMIFFVSERPDDGADFSIIAIHILGIADTFQECVVVLVLLRIVASLYHLDIASDGFLPGIEAVVVMAGRIVEPEQIIVLAANVAGSPACFKPELSGNNLRIEYSAFLHDLEEIGEIQRQVRLLVEAKTCHFLL